MDEFVMGHPSGGRYRSPNEFAPHIMWLLKDEFRDPDNCTCVLCFQYPRHQSLAGVETDIDQSLAGELLPTDTQHTPRNDEGSRSPAELSAGRSMVVPKSGKEVAKLRTSVPSFGVESLGRRGDLVNSESPGMGRRLTRNSLKSIIVAVESWEGSENRRQEMENNQDSGNAPGVRGRNDFRDAEASRLATTSDLMIGNEAESMVVELKNQLKATVACLCVEPAYLMYDAYDEYTHDEGPSTQINSESPKAVKGSDAPPLRFSPRRRRPASESQLNESSGLHTQTTSTNIVEPRGKRAVHSKKRSQSIIGKQDLKSRKRPLEDDISNEPSKKVNAVEVVTESRATVVRSSSRRKLNAADIGAEDGNNNCGDTEAPTFTTEHALVESEVEMMSVERKDQPHCLMYFSDDEPSHDQGPSNKINSPKTVKGSDAPQLRVSSRRRKPALESQLNESSGLSDQNTSMNIVESRRKSSFKSKRRSSQYTIKSQDLEWRKRPLEDESTSSDEPSKKVNALEVAAESQSTPVRSNPRRKLQSATQSDGMNNHSMSVKSLEYDRKLGDLLKAFTAFSIQGGEDNDGVSKNRRGARDVVPNEDITIDPTVAVNSEMIVNARD
ncbi:hypothetical protein HDU76_003743, partial [Blyttiomyces sp. JEL0837]